MALNQQEENTLRRLAQENSPMRSVNAVPQTPRESDTIPQLDAWTKLPKLQPVDPNDDYGFISRVRHVMKSGEKLMQFIARTNLSRAQAYAMTKEEISSFVAQTERNAENDSTRPPSFTWRELPPKQPRAILV